jgi:hypothetical protein
MIKKHQRNITGFNRKVYFAYFGVKLGDQYKSWAPHKVCFMFVYVGYSESIRRYFFSTETT